MHEFFRSLPTDRFPVPAALGEHVRVDDRDRRFSAGLDPTLAGLLASAGTQF